MVARTSSAVRGGRVNTSSSCLCVRPATFPYAVISVGVPIASTSRGPGGKPSSVNRPAASVVVACGTLLLAVRPLTTKTAFGESSVGVVLVVA